MPTAPIDPSLVLCQAWVVRNQLASLDEPELLNILAGAVVNVLDKSDLILWKCENEGEVRVF